jgi:hypothetical protein
MRQNSTDAEKARADHVPLRLLEYREKDGICLASPNLVLHLRIGVI